MGTTGLASHDTNWPPCWRTNCWADSPPFDPTATRLVSNPSSGTFLSAPRRTGKSTFLKKDLMAEGKRFILIIDEAQHALSTSQGVNSPYALKAARDALNMNEDDPRLILLCTGSHRSKQANLLTTKDHPFFGSRVRDFPTTGNPQGPA